MNGEAKRLELERIRLEHEGILRAVDVVEAASIPESPLHGEFEWDNGKAAHQYRLDQARDLIRVFVTVIDSSPKAPVQVYVSLGDDRKIAGGGYRLMVDVLADPESRARFLAEALDDFQRAEAKYGRLKELAPVFAAVKRVRKSRAKAAA